MLSDSMVMQANLTTQARDQPASIAKRNWTGHPALAAAICWASSSHHKRISINVMVDHPNSAICAKSDIYVNTSHNPWPLTVDADKLPLVRVCSRRGMLFRKNSIHLRPSHPNLDRLPFLQSCRNFRAI
jgi:hypothetical protein